jgi:hypothetical protein
MVFIGKMVTRRAAVVALQGMDTSRITLLTRMWNLTDPDVHCCRHPQRPAEIYCWNDCRQALCSACALEYDRLCPECWRVKCIGRLERQISEIDAVLPLMRSAVLRKRAALVLNACGCIGLLAAGVSGDHWPLLFWIALLLYLLPVAALRLRGGVIERMQWEAERGDRAKLDGWAETAFIWFFGLCWHWLLAPLSLTNGLVSSARAIREMAARRIEIEAELIRLCGTSGLP